MKKDKIMILIYLYELCNCKEESIKREERNKK